LPNTDISSVTRTKLKIWNPTRYRHPYYRWTQWERSSFHQTLPQTSRVRGWPSNKTLYPITLTYFQRTRSL
jgi:hypothetical protein